MLSENDYLMKAVRAPTSDSSASYGQGTLHKAVKIFSGANLLYLLICSFALIPVVVERQIFGH